MNTGKLKQILQISDQDILNLFITPPQRGVRISEEDRLRALHLIQARDRNICEQELERKFLMDLTQEQLQNSVIYLACALDFTPLTLFSDESDFFIYVDWSWDCWSQTREQCIETFTSKQIPEKKHQGLFRPLSVAGMKDRIDAEGEFKDWGLKGDITKKFDELNRRHNYDLEIIDEGRSVPLETIGFDANFRWPDNFQLTAQEQEAIDQHDTNQWAQQCTIRLGEKRLKMLFVCAEGLTAYSAFFSSGKIAPMILVTDNVGMMGYAPLDDPNGITKRFLDCCVAKPHWIHGGGKR